MVVEGEIHGDNWLVRRGERMGIKKIRSVNLVLHILYQMQIGILIFLATPTSLTYVNNAYVFIVFLPTINCNYLLFRKQNDLRNNEKQSH